MARNQGIYAILREVSLRSGCYCVENVRELEALLSGFWLCADEVGRGEESPPFRHFRWWLARKFGDHIFVIHIPAAFEKHFPDASVALRTYFELVEEFSERQATVLATIEPDDRHAPTGKLEHGILVDGVVTDLTWNKPTMARIVQYTGDSGLYLEYHFATPLRPLHEDYLETVDEVVERGERDFRIARDHWVWNESV